LDDRFILLRAGKKVQLKQYITHSLWPWLSEARSFAGCDGIALLKWRAAGPYSIPQAHRASTIKENIMANVTRYPLDDAFDELLRGFFVRPVGFDAHSGQAAAPFRVEVAEKDNTYVIRAEIPGVRKEDIAITVDGDQVAITAEVKNEKDAKDGERILRSERYYGKVHRAFTLGQPVDENGAGANYADGVLELTLPKKAAASARRITIQ